MMKKRNMNKRRFFRITWLLVLSFLAGSLFMFGGIVDALDLDLSNADAACLGEDSNDRSGHLVPIRAPVVAYIQTSTSALLTPDGRWAWGSRRRLLLTPHGN